MRIPLSALGREPKNRRAALRLMGAGAVGAGLLPLLSACDAPTDSGLEEASATGDIGAGNLRIVADGLRFPEGPVPLNDGSVLVVEIERGTLTRIDPDGLVEVIANLGGGPNGAAIGPDGTCYVCNNGGFEWHETEDGLLLPGDQPDDYDGGSIQKVDLVTGEVSTLYTEIDGERLRGPNDLVFDGQGGFWFTDLGKSRADELDRGALCYARADGSMIKRVVYPLVMPNGCGLSPDGETVYVAGSWGARLWAFEITGEGEVVPPSGLFPGRLVAAPGGDSFFDSMAVEENGAICIATPLRGGITRITPDGGTIQHYPLDDFLTTNIAFGGPDMKTAFITSSARGELVAVDWPHAGLRLAHSA